MSDSSEGHRDGDLQGRSHSISNPRVAIGSLLTECNQFGGSPIDLDWFKRYELLWGDEMLAIDAGVVGGALQVLSGAGAQLAPLLSASTCPGGCITMACYQRLRSELLERLRLVLPVDGVLLLLHGAAVAEGVDDPEGDIIQAVRQLVGRHVPIVATLDLHAHVTQTMVEHAHGLVAWATYPHRDAQTTGERGANLLLDTMSGRCRPMMALAKVPVIVGGLNGSTDGEGAFARIMRAARAHEEGDGVLSSSVFLVHTFLDQPDLGGGGLFITDGDSRRSRTLAEETARQFWACRDELEAKAVAPTEAIRAGLALEGGPVVLVETADCAGGGAAGDSVATLRAVLAIEDPPATLAPVVDPVAAAACHEAGVGACLQVRLGHGMDPQWGTPLQVDVVVQSLHDGRFRYAGGIWDDVVGEMGATAVVAIGKVRVLITSHATYDWADEQWQAVGIDPRQTKFVIAKNPMNFHNVYDEVARGVFILDTPGPTPATIRQHPLQHMRRPYFPADDDISDLEPTVWTNEGLYE
jgi:microcystin degradation protein MlrC